MQYRINKIIFFGILFFMCQSLLFSLESTPTKKNITISSVKNNKQISFQNNLKNNKKKTGPTLPLKTYDISKKEIPIADFLYFVPMISPVKVKNVVSKNNTQKVRITSVSREKSGDNITITCNFHIMGKGYCSNLFDPKEIIKRNLGEVKKGEPLKNLLEYIRLDNGGYGKFIIKCHKVANKDNIGTKNIGERSKFIVDEVRVDFNANKHLSPVKVGLYSVKSVNNKYSYKNKYNVIVAGINSLIFRRTDSNKHNPPRMEIVIHSIENKKLTNSLWGRFKGFVANLLIDPIEISCEGNLSILAFGTALMEKKESYTFPLAIRLVKEKKIKQ